MLITIINAFKYLIENLYYTVAPSRQAIEPAPPATPVEVGINERPQPSTDIRSRLKNIADTNNKIDELNKKHLHDQRLLVALRKSDKSPKQKEKLRAAIESRMNDNRERYTELEKRANSRVGR